MIVTNTNKYAVANNIKDWKPVTTKSMHGFIAMVFNMGLVRKNQLHDYWFKRNSTPWFRMMMSCERFKKILRSFHVVDNATIPPKEDPAYRSSQMVRLLLDYFNVICMHHLYPYQSVAIDKSLVAGKTCNPVRQYLPNKHHGRWGTKVWLLADSSTAYVLKRYIYEGAKYDPTTGIAGTGYDVVRLMEMAGLYDQGHHLFTDNLFTTYAVAMYLLERNTFLTGTMRRNQLWNLPEEIVKAKPKVGEMVYYHQNNFLAMSYRQKKSQSKPVLMLSTYKGAYSVPHRKHADKVIPAITDTYNQSMGGGGGGVDSSDQVMYSYMCERESRNWSKKVVFSLITRLLMNSYVLYQTTVRVPKRRIEYIKDIIDSFAADFKTVDVIPDLPTIGLTRLPNNKERDCVVCSDRCVPGGRKRAKTMCNGCSKGLHGTCSTKNKCK